MKIGIGKYSAKLMEKGVHLSRQGVLYRIKNGLSLEGVKKSQLVAGRYVLTVDDDWMQQGCKNKVHKKLVK